MNISVLIPNYNKGEFVADAIESVIRQTTHRWDIYWCDDGSTDDSRENVRKFENNPKVNIMFNEKNMGLGYTLDRLIKASKNDLVCFLGSDDGLVPDCLEKVLRVYEKHPEYGFVYTNFWFCDLKFNKIRRGHSRKLPPGRTNLEADCISAMQTFRKSMYLATEGLDQSLTGAIDKDLIYKLEEVTKPVFLNECLYLYRRLKHSMSRGNGAHNVVQNCLKVRKAAGKRRGIIVV